MLQYPIRRIKRRKVKMESDSYKEVYFDQYCKTCKHSKKAEADDPCDECLAEPVNLYSHKPIYYEKEGIK